MDYCKLNCKANKRAFKQIVDEINNGGGGGGGVTKITITDADHLFSDTLNVKVDDQLLINISTNNANYPQLIFTGFAMAHGNTETDFIGYGTLYRGTARLGIQCIVINRLNNTITTYQATATATVPITKEQITEIHYSRLLKF